MAEAKPLISFQTRMPVDIRDWLKQKAREADRSMNNMILALLREAKQQDEDAQ